MSQNDEAAGFDYPHGRGYGHDYMRGGEVFGGYGYAQREEYARPRGELSQSASSQPVETRTVTPPGAGSTVSA